jgi:phage terminase large subunit GpA-like protein
MSHNPAYSLVFNAFVNGVKPDPKMDLYEYSNTYRYLSSTGAIEHGKYDMNRIACLIPIAKLLSPSSEVREIILCKGVQIGSTELANNALMMYAHLYHRPVMGMLPTKDLATRHAKKKFWTGINASPELAKFFYPIKNGVKNVSSTLNIKSAGGEIDWLWSESKNNYASSTYQFVVASDIDRYPDDVEGEGDPITLLQKRMTTAGRSKKFFVESSPTKKGKSKVYAEMLNGTQNRLFMHCPHCEEMICFIKDNFRYEWDRDNYSLIGDVKYCCDKCGGMIEDWQKYEMMTPEKGARLIPMNPNYNNKYRESIIMPSYYSPFLSWNNIFEEYLTALYYLEKKGNHLKMKVWTNTIDASEYDDGSGAVDIDITIDALLDKREDYEKVPNDVVMLSAGVDTQNNRFEATVLGWVNNREKYVIGHYVVGGDPKFKETQEILDYLLFEMKFEREDGKEMGIFTTAIDTGGGRTEVVYDYCQKRQSKPLYPIKGGRSIEDPLVKTASSIRTKKNRDLKLYILGVNSGKDDIISDVLDDNSNYLHFPFNIKRYVKGSPKVEKSGVELDMEDEQYFAQLTVESIDENGRYTNKKRLPNEAIDCMVYANAAYKIHRNLLKRNGIMLLDLDSISERGVVLGTSDLTAIVKPKKRRIFSKGVRR